MRVDGEREKSKEGYTYITPGGQDTIEGTSTYNSSGEQYNFEDYTFLFPQTSSTSYVRLTPEKDLNLQAFTLCLRVSTEVSSNQETILFAYRTEEADELNLWQEYGLISLYLRSSKKGAMFNLPALKTFPTHLCVTWESHTGVTAFWVDGQRSTRKIYRRGHQVKSGGAIVLGQDPDSYLGSFDSKQCFVGEITDVQMFDYVLSPRQIKKLYEKQYTRPKGNVLNWNSLKYKIHDDVLILPDSEV